MAKKIRSVKVGVSTADVLRTKTSVLAVGLYEDKKLKSCELAGEVDSMLGGSLKQAFKLGSFKGKAGEVFHLLGSSQMKADNVLLIGLGKFKDAQADTFRKACAKAVSKAVDIKAVSIFIACFENLSSKLDAKDIAQAGSEGAFLGGYRYDEFITSDKNRKSGSLKVSFALSGDDANFKAMREGVEIGSVTGDAQSFARTLANKPANYLTPVKFAAEANKLSNKYKNLSCKIIDEKEMVKLGMGGILAVGQGSVNKPRMMVLKYTPAKKSKSKPLGLVGKAITFDSGGISLKPGAGMDMMKLDKSGGVAVLAAMKGIAELKPSREVFGIICAAENMPSGGSYRPGDIVTTYSGKTVEVLNTDAEGRMVLCDGIHYAVEKKCEIIVDVATLTGACLVALGENKAGLFGNDDGLIESLKKSAERTDEEIWHLPSGGKYAKDMMSDIADLKNIASTRWGGASHAASFLCEFAGDSRWAHLDIAGPGTRYLKDYAKNAGAEGFGVRLLIDFVLRECFN